MPTCPSGHDSASDDFCDVCGIRIGAPTLSSVDAGPGPSATASASVGPSTGDVCPACGAPRTGQFCEDCGHNFVSAAPVPVPPAPAQQAPVPPDPVPPAPVPPAPVPPVTALPAVDGADGVPGSGTWSAAVTADRGYFDAVQAASGPDADSIGFPAYCPERRFRLTGGEVRIGRRSASRGIDPEIDLTGPPADPGVSRLHAVLIAAPDGSWSVIDPGSANGTLVNGSEIPANEPVPLRDGDRINLGAWTLVTVSREK
jgi:FHA domain